jgi:uncharacterized membrane protein
MSTLAAKKLTLVCAGLLLLAVVSGNILAGFNLLILVLQCFPLLLTFPGLLKNRTRSIQWLCFLDLFFLTHGILKAFTPGQFIPGIAEAVICVALFVSAIIFIRSLRQTP